jgi:hypothetical protein
MYEELFDYPNVVGAGIGKEDLVVMVERKLPKAALAESELIPKSFRGVFTDVIEVGTLVAPRPLAPLAITPQSHTSKVRPAPGGVSIGHEKITAGTLGCLVYDVHGKTMILSNNHVLANSNDAIYGDPILQPGPADGGEPYRDKIGNLYRFVKIVFSEDGSTCPVADSFARLLSSLAKLIGSTHRLKSHKTSQAANKVDAAIAIPLNNTIVTNTILDITGTVNQWERANVGDKVRKSGRTTEYTEGEIIVQGATVKVQYGGGKVATFEDQFVTGPISKGGDSGSLIVKRDEPVALGLLFAGSDQVTICNNIYHVLTELNVAF